MPTKARPDYRLVRHARTAPKQPKNVVAKLRLACPKCATQTNHIIVTGLRENRKCTYAICDECTSSRFWKWIEPSPLSDPEKDKKSLQSQSLKTAMNNWVSNHASELFSNVPKRLIRYAGLKDSADITHEILAVPTKFDRHMRQEGVMDKYIAALQMLQGDDPNLFAFIYFNANGLSYAQMNDYFAFAIVRERSGKKRRSGGGRVLSGHGNTLVAKRTEFLFGLAPEVIRNAELATRIEHSGTHVLVSCPCCQGEGDSSCVLCKGNQQVREKTARKYQDRMATEGKWVKTLDE